MKALRVLLKTILLTALICTCFILNSAFALTPGYKQVNSASIGSVTVTKGTDVTSVQVPDNTPSGGEPTDILYTDAQGKAWKVKKNDKGEVVIEAATPPTPGISGVNVAHEEDKLQELSAFLAD